MRTSDLVNTTVRLIRAKRASTFYLNGAPGSGKSHLLRELTNQLPREVPRSQVLGPYPITGTKPSNIGQRILQDCAEGGFLDTLPPSAVEADLAGLWRWLGKNIQAAQGQSFLVLIDLSGDDPPNLTTAANLFSSARYLEGAWPEPGIRVFHMFAGYWDQPALEQYYGGIKTSFPYTVGHNQAIWDGLCVEDMVNLAHKACPGSEQIILGRILFELTGGHPAAALDILDRSAEDKHSFNAILEATRQAAADGAAGQALLRAWGQLPTESRLALRDLVLGRQIPVTALPSHLESLYIAGAVRKERIGAQTYIALRSWYATLLVLLHPGELGIANEQIGRIRASELMPQALELNTEAYRLIKDIEVQVRNFVTIQLCLRSDAPKPILGNRSRKFNSHSKTYNDAQQRAEDWRKRSASRGLPVALNPLLAYLSTRDLADVIKEIALDSRSEAWRSIAEAIQDLSDVRDAVMHNQLVDNAAVQRLYDLQAAIYEALSQTDRPQAET